MITTTQFPNSKIVPYYLENSTDNSRERRLKAISTINSLQPTKENLLESVEELVLAFVQSNTIDKAEHLAIHKGLSLLITQLLSTNSYITASFEQQFDKSIFSLLNKLTRSAFPFESRLLHVQFIETEHKFNNTMLKVLSIQDPQRTQLLSPQSFYLSDESIEILPAFKNLKKIEISSRSRITSKIFSAIGQLTSLEHLSFAKIIDSKDLIELRPLIHLTELNLTQGNDDVEDTIRHFHELRFLELGEITENIIPTLRQFKHLTRVKFQISPDCNLDRLGHELSQWDTLIKLEIYAGLRVQKKIPQAIHDALRILKTKNLKYALIVFLSESETIQI